MPPEHQPDAPPYPTYYVDFFVPELNDVTLTIVFGKRKAPEAPPVVKPEAVPPSVATTFPEQSRPQLYRTIPGIVASPSHAVHLNPLYAKVMALAILKMIAALEKFEGFRYPLPAHLAQMFDISAEDWQ